jgi:hypothetical protein
MSIFVEEGAPIAQQVYGKRERNFLCIPVWDIQARQTNNFQCTFLEYCNDDCTYNLMFRLSTTSI